VDGNRQVRFSVVRRIIRQLRQIGRPDLTAFGEKRDEGIDHACRIVLRLTEKDTGFLLFDAQFRWSGHAIGQYRLDFIRQKLFAVLVVRIQHERCAARGLEERACGQCHATDRILYRLFNRGRRREERDRHAAVGLLPLLNGDVLAGPHPSIAIFGFIGIPDDKDRGLQQQPIEVRPVGGIFCSQAQCLLQGIGFVCVRGIGEILHASPQYVNTWTSSVPND